MAKKNAAAAPAAPAEQQFRILRGLGPLKATSKAADGRSLEGVRYEAGDLVSAADLPAHGSAQCGAECPFKGSDHDWFLTGAGSGGDSVIERYPPPPPPEPGALSVVEGAGAVSLADDAGAVSLPAEE